MKIILVWKASLDTLGSTFLFQMQNLLREECLSSSQGKTDFTSWNQGGERLGKAEEASLLGLDGHDMVGTLMIF